MLEAPKAHKLPISNWVITQLRGRPHLLRSAAILTLLICVYGIWLFTFWPGVLGEDSVAILREVHNPEQFRSGKTVVWYFFVKLLYGTSGRVEISIATSMLLCAIFLSRMLAWYWAQGMHRAFALGVLFVALAPHMIYFIGTLYPDGLFAISSVALLFEIWLCTKRRQVTNVSLVILILTLPFAVFLRPNGIVLLAPVLMCSIWLDARSRKRWLAAVGAWCAIVLLAQQAHRTTTQETQFPLAIFETAGFLQKRAMNDLWSLYPHMNDPWVLQKPKVTQATLDALQRNQVIDKLQQYRDPAYWDMLVFHPEGPQVGSMSPEDKQTIVREFWGWNLWRNLPDFLGSRINVFFSAALAQGGFPALTYASNVLPRVTTASQFRHWGWDQAESVWRWMHVFSYEWRWILWTPWLGLVLLIRASVTGLRNRDWPILLVSIPMLVQLVGIFMFSIAGEYRYLLPFFVLPMALWPALSAQPERKPHK